ncbi:MAG: hypothetical protein ACXWT3_12785 [Methylococcaceae bacterium]
MDTNFIRLIIESDIKSSLGKDINPFSREYLLAKKYSEKRTLSGRASCPIYDTTQLEAIVNLLITPEERAAIFPSPYDLGSLIPLEKTQITYLKVYEHLKIVHKQNDPSDLVKAIKKAIKVRTGFDFNAFKEVDGSIAIKVLCTLYRFQLAYSQMFRYFQSPKDSGKASFEFRTAYELHEISKTAAQMVSFIADLKANMTFEMLDDDAEALKSFLYCLPARLANTEEWFCETWFKMGNDANSTYEQIRDLVTNALPLGNKTVPERLDKQLYINLCTLELEHRNQANDDLFRFVISDKPDHQPLTKLPGINLNSCDYKPSEVRAAVEYALATRMSDKQFNEAYVLSEAILELHEMKNFPVKLDPVNLHRRVAAVLCLTGENIKKLTYKPYWLGQKNITGLLLPSLKRFSKGESWQSIPEAHLEYWRLKYNYIYFLSKGYETYWIAASEFAVYLDNRVSECLRTNEFNVAKQSIEAFLSECGV